MAQIPITILSGFLGAGKTTLMNNILNGEHGLKIAVLVNDFGSINIDAQLVVSTEENMVNLANGCICCTIRDDLVQSTLNLINRPDPPEYIIVEASGVSEPLEIVRTFASASFVTNVKVDSILTVIDAEQLSTLEGENSVLAMDQISVADIILLNKIDLVTAEQLATVKRDWIEDIAPQARVIETTYSQAPLELILGVGHYSPDRLLHHAAKGVHVHSMGGHVRQHHHTPHDLIFETWHWESDHPLNLKAVQKTIQALPRTIFRAKGFVYIAEDVEHRYLLQVVGKRAQLAKDAPWGEALPRSQVVMIGSHDGVPAQNLQQQFEACHQTDASSPNPLKSVLNWLRGE